MIDELLQSAFSEYGLLVAILLISVYVLFKRVVKLTEFIMTSLQESTRVLSELTAIIKNKKND